MVKPKKQKPRKAKDVKCHACNGSGRWSWSDDSYSSGSCPCDKCYGTGKRVIGL